LVKLSLPSPSPPERAGVVTRTSSSGRLTGSDRSITASMRLKIAVFAPMASPRERIATSAKPGLARSERSA
jgi:hypothetical protein